MHFASLHTVTAAIPLVFHVSRCLRCLRCLHVGRADATHPKIVEPDMVPVEMDNQLARFQLPAALQILRPEVKKTVILVNGTGRQAASVIRTVSALCYAVRAQVSSHEGLVAEELADLPNVSLMEGSLLDNPSLIDALFEGS